MCFPYFFTLKIAIFHCGHRRVTTGYLHRKALRPRGRYRLLHRSLIAQQIEGHVGWSVLGSSGLWRY